MSGPLHDFRIVDTSERSPAAAIAGMMLSDLGAEVIRVEPEGGDPIRALDASRIWLRGQKSVIVGPEQLRDGSWARLCSSADVWLHTAQPWLDKPDGLLEAAPADPGQVRATLTAHPSLATADARPGQGLAPVYGEIVEAQYGFLDVQDGSREGPIFLGWPHAAFGAAWLLESGILAALFEREKSGRGQTLTTSLLDGMAILSTSRWFGGESMPEQTKIPSTIGRMGNARIIVSLFECENSEWVQVHTGPRGAFNRLMQVVGREDLVAEGGGSFLGMMMEPDVADELWDFLRTTFKQRTADDWRKALSAVDVCCMPALPPGDGLWLEQMEANGLVDKTEDGRRLGAFVKYDRTKLVVARDVPEPGADGASLLASARPRRVIAGSDVAKDAASLESPEAARGPLDGLLVLDFGFFMAGPFAPRLLSDLGARVIKIEELRGEPMRGPRPSAGFFGVQRGKEGLAIDLKSEEGRAIVHELVARADLVHHNMRAAPLERLGIDYPTLQKVNPRLIYCHSSGYGNEGPWSALPTLEPLHSALTGILRRSGGEENPPVMYLTHMDFGCALTAAGAVLAALVERERSGQGQYLEVPQTGAGLLAMCDVYFDADGKHETFPLDRDQRGHAPTNALYRTKDGWLVLSCYAEPEWRAVPHALGIDSSSWPAYAEARSQRLDVGESARAIESALAERSTLSALRAFSAAGVPATCPTPADGARLLADPLLRELGVLTLEQHPEAGTIWEVGHTLRFTRTSGQHAVPGPVLGQDTSAILAEIGRSQAEIDALLENGIVAS